MNILLLTQILPYPPDAGPKVKTWHVLRYFIRSGHQVTLVSYVRDDEQKYVPEIQQLGVKVYPIPIRRSRVMDVLYLLRSQFTGRPFLIERDDLPPFRRLVNQLLGHESFDVIHADQLTMTLFAQPDRSSSQLPDRIFDAHNATWSIFERMQENASPIMKPFLWLEAKRIKKYEAQVVRNFEHTLVVTEQDRQLLAQAVEEHAGQLDALKTKIHKIPIAVDTQQLQPLQTAPHSTNIVTLGTLHYPPNADGIRWFMEHVYPIIKSRIPSVSLTVIGKNPPDDFLRAARQDSSIKVTGYVPNLDPYLQQAAVMVVPVRAGSGMRVRILEAFARAIPVVTTTIGLEGIDAEPEVEVLVADTAESFAHQVCRILEDSNLRQALSQKGRYLSVTKYDWQSVLSSLDELYSEISKNQIE